MVCKESLISVTLEFKEFNWKPAGFFSYFICEQGIHPFNCWKVPKKFVTIEKLKRDKGGKRNGVFLLYSMLKQSEVC